MMDDPQDAALRQSGLAIRTLREEAGLSQEALSFEANVDQSTLSRVERLGPHTISWKKLRSIAKALGCVVEISLVRSGTAYNPPIDEHRR